MVKLSCRQQSTISTRKELYLYDTIQSAFFGRYFFGLPGNLWIRQTGLPVSAAGTYWPWWNCPCFFSEAFLFTNGQNPAIPFKRFSLGAHYPAYFLHTYRLPSSDLPSLFQASQGILRLWKSTWRFQDHPFQTGFPGRSPDRFWKACWSYGTHLPGHWPFQSRHDYLWLFRHWGLGGWK